MCNHTIQYKTKNDQNQKGSSHFYFINTPSIENYIFRYSCGIFTEITQCSRTHNIAKMRNACYHNSFISFHYIFRSQFYSISSVAL